MSQAFTFLGLLLAFAIVNTNPVKRQVIFGGGCIVTGNKLYQNGVYVRDLTTAEQSQYNNYTQAMNTWSQQFSAQMAQWSQQMNSAFANFNPFTNPNVNTPTAGTPPPAPQAPSFCPAYNGVAYNGVYNVQQQQGPTYYFNGCSVNNNRVYVNGQYARDLTDQEKTALATYTQQMQQWQQNQQQSMQQYQQQVQQAVASFNPLSANNTGLKMPTVPPQQQLPQAPAICSVIAG